MTSVTRLAFISFGVLLCVSSPAAQQAAKQWEVTELSFRSEPPAGDAFAVEFGAVFSLANGDAHRIPGYYDGGDQWKVRFCPPQVGDWSYTTFSSLPGLAGQTGKLKATANTDPQQPGPVAIHEVKRQHFVYADGTPYFCLAFELDWLFALDAENPDDIPKSRRLLSAVAQNGFNQIVMNVFAYDATWGEKHKVKPENNYARPKVYPFGGNNERPDHSTLNVEFFQRFDRVMHELNRQGLIAHLMIYVWNKKVNWPAAESPADNRYFDYVVKRYQAFPNLIWDISKEALGYGHDDMGYITRRIERLRRLDGHGRLLTVRLQLLPSPSGRGRLHFHPGMAAVSLPPHD